MPDKRIIYRVSGILLLLFVIGCGQTPPPVEPPPPVTKPIIPQAKPKLPAPVAKPDLIATLAEQNDTRDEGEATPFKTASIQPDTVINHNHRDQAHNIFNEDKRREFFISLYQAHIFLSTFSRERSFDSLDEAGQFLTKISAESKVEYPIMTELTFLHHSTLSRIYIPMKRGPKRFKEVSQALALLSGKKLKAVDFRLVSYDFPYNDPNAARIIIDAKAILQDKTIKDESYAFLTAEHELDKFSRLLMNIQPYKGAARSQFILNYQAARLFLDTDGNYELSKIALKRAKKGLADFLAENSYIGQDQAQQYKENIAQLEQALDKKDQTPLGKLDGWLSRLVNEDLISE